MYKELNEQTKQVVAELLALDKNACKAIHRTFAIDFEAPFTAVKIEGKFTIKSAEKALEQAGAVIPADAKWDCIACLIKAPHYSWRKDKTIIARLYPILGKVGINITWNEYRQAASFDSFNTKGDFEDYRKLNETAYFIWQNREYRKAAAEYKTEHTTIDRNGRFIFVEEKYRRKKYRRTDASGECMEFYDYEEVDKSGYILYERRKEQEQKLKALKAERRKAEYEATDDTAKVEQLEKALNAYRERLAGALKIADSYKMIHAIGRALNGWNALDNAWEHFEKYKERTLNREYASIERANNAYDSIKEIINGIDMTEIDKLLLEKGYFKISEVA